MPGKGVPSKFGCECVVEPATSEKNKIFVLRGGGTDVRLLKKFKPEKILKEMLVFIQRLPNTNQSALHLIPLSLEYVPCLMMSIRHSHTWDGA